MAEFRDRAGRLTIPSTPAVMAGELQMFYAKVSDVVSYLARESHYLQLTALRCASVPSVEVNIPSSDGPAPRLWPSGLYVRFLWEMSAGVLAPISSGPFRITVVERIKVTMSEMYGVPRGRVIASPLLCRRWL